MSRNPDEALTYRRLYESPLVCVRDYVCRACRGGPAAEEHSYGNHIVLMRRGAFCKHLGRRSVTADVNQAVYFRSGFSLPHQPPGRMRGSRDGFHRLAASAL